MKFTKYRQHILKCRNKAQIGDLNELNSADKKQKTTNIFTTIREAENLAKRRKYKQSMQLRSKIGN